MTPESTHSEPVQLPTPLRRLLEEALSSDQLDLPLLPSTAAEVMGVCNEEQCDARQLSELLQRDPSLAGHVLRVANSAAYAPKEPIVSLQQAVSRLGVTTICEIAIAVSLKGRVFHVPGYHVRIREMWMHAAAAAVYAKEVARRLRRNVEGAFLCGLLHDVGKPIVMQAFLDIVRERTSRSIPPVIMESAMDEFHQEVGARMVAAWSLSPWMAEAVRHHHDYALAGEHRDEAMVTCLADELSHWALNEELGPDDFPAELPVVRDLGFYATDLVALLEARGAALEVTEAFL